jgi:hypothetical protein
MMHLVAQTKIKAVLSALFESMIPVKDKTKTTVNAKAYRIGPARVILKIALNDNFNGLDVYQIAIDKMKLQFNLDAFKNENIAVSLASANDDFGTSDQSAREHRATLKVRPETNQLTLTFRTSNNDVFLTQKIAIE